MWFRSSNTLSTIFLIRNYLRFFPKSFQYQVYGHENLKKITKYHEIICILTVIMFTIKQSVLILNKIGLESNLNFKNLCTAVSSKTRVSKPEMPLDKLSREFIIFQSNNLQQMDKVKPAEKD